MAQAYRAVKASRCRKASPAEPAPARSGMGSVSSRAARASAISLSFQPVDRSSRKMVAWSIPFCCACSIKCRRFSCMVAPAIQLHRCALLGAHGKDQNYRHPRSQRRQEHSRRQRDNLAARLLPAQNAEHESCRQNNGHQRDTRNKKSWSSSSDYLRTADRAGTDSDYTLRMSMLPGFLRRDRGQDITQKIKSVSTRAWEDGRVPDPDGQLPER